MIVKVPYSVARQIPPRGGKVFIQSESLVVVIDDMLLQCWNCRGFNHKSTSCPKPSHKGKPETLCPKCGEVHERSKSCSNLRCSNCHKENIRRNLQPGDIGAHDTDHASDNYRECSVANRIRSSIRYTIYGEQ